MRQLVLIMRLRRTGSYSFSLVRRLVTVTEEKDGHKWGTIQLRNMTVNVRKYATDKYWHNY